MEYKWLLNKLGVLEKEIESYAVDVENVVFLENSVLCFIYIKGRRKA